MAQAPNPAAPPPFTLPALPPRTHPLETAPARPTPSPASPAPSYTSNGTLGRVCTAADPHGTGEDDKHKKLADATRRWSDHASGRNPLPPERSLALRKEIDDLSRAINPRAQNLWGPYSPAEQQYLADQRRASNNLGIWFLGPIAGGPAALARLSGAPENVVEAAGEAGLGLMPGPGRGRAAPASRGGLTPPPRGAYVDARRYRKPNGEWEYPERDGFQGEPRERMTRPGERFDRFGGEGGRFTAPDGTPFDGRSLPPSAYDQPYNVYEVVRPYPVMEGPAAPWFGQPGGGLQQMHPRPIGDLVERGYLRRLP